MHPMSRLMSDDGEVRLLNPADYETKDSYTFDVIVSDGELSDTQTVTVNVTDVDEADNSNEIIFEEDNWHIDVLFLDINTLNCQLLLMLMAAKHFSVNYFQIINDNLLAIIN